MKRTLLRALVTATIVAGIAWVFLFSSTKPRILVLHSMSQGSDWAMRVDQGIAEALRKNRQPMSVAYHYMNLDEAGSEAQIRIAATTARQAIANQKPAILIAIDDESNTLVASRMSAVKRPAIVYSAILRPPAVYGYEGVPSRSTGIEEDVPSEAIVELLRLIYGSKPLRVAVLGIDDITGQAEMARLLEDDWGTNIVGPTRLVKDLVQWQAFVTHEAQEADVLIVLSTDMLSGDQPEAFLPEKTVIEWTEANSRVLPIGIRDSYVRFGGGLAVTSASSTYGRLAMQLSLEWMRRGLDAAAPAPLVAEGFNVAMRVSVLNARGIALPQVYQELARASGSLYP